MFEKLGENIVYKALASKIKEIKPQQLIDVFQAMVKDKVAKLKKADDDKDGRSNFDEIQDELSKIGASSVRIHELLEDAEKVK